MKGKRLATNGGKRYLVENIFGLGLTVRAVVRSGQKYSVLQRMKRDGVAWRKCGSGKPEYINERCGVCV